MYGLIACLNHSMSLSRMWRANKVCQNFFWIDEKKVTEEEEEYNEDGKRGCVAFSYSLVKKRKQEKGGGEQR